MQDVGGATVDVYYKLPTQKEKHSKFAEVYMAGDMIFYFKPPPTLMVGTLRGYVNLC